MAGLLEAYRSGWFPMADPGMGTINWYSPEQRGIIPLEGFRVPRSLAQRVRSGRFSIVSDRAFGRVIRACAGPRLRRGKPDKGGTWIDDRIVEAYTLLHRVGHAHSVEAWLKPGSGARAVLVGGLYGVSIGGAFFGESMFSRPERGGTDASKVCLVHLVRHLCRRGYVLLDTQMSNPHLEQFGCVEVPRAIYLERLKAAIAQQAEWTPFETGGEPQPSTSV